MTGPYQGQYPQQPHQQPQYPYQHQQPPPPPPAAQPQPQPQGQGPANGQSAIAVTTMFMWLGWIFFFIKPKIFVNGHEVPTVWGRNLVPVPPGQHHVHVHVPYFLPSKVGPADLMVPVHPGQPPVELEYRAPVWAFARGSLGPPPQQYNGMGLMIGITVGALALFCLCCGVSVLAN